MVLSGLLSHVGYTRLRGNARSEVTGITCDSREVKSGALFVCLAGCRVDGHLFAEEALRRGASAVVMEEGNREAKKLEEQLRRPAPVLGESQRQNAPGEGDGETEKRKS